MDDDYQHVTDAVELEDELAYNVLLLEGLDPEEEDFNEVKRMYENKIHAIERRLEELSNASAQPSPQTIMQQTRAGLQTEPIPLDFRGQQPSAVHRHGTPYSQMDGSNDSVDSPASTDSADAMSNRKRPRALTTTTPEHGRHKMVKIPHSSSASGYNTPSSVDSLEALDRTHTAQPGSSAAVRQNNDLARLQEERRVAQGRALQQRMAAEFAAGGQMSNRMPPTNHQPSITSPLPTRQRSNMAFPGMSGAGGRAPNNGFAVPNGYAAAAQNPQTFYQGGAQSRPNLAQASTQVKREPSFVPGVQPGSMPGAWPSAARTNGASSGSTSRPQVIDLTGDDDDSDDVQYVRSVPTPHRTNQQMMPATYAGQPVYSMHQQSQNMLPSHAQNGLQNNGNINAMSNTWLSAVGQSAHNIFNRAHNQINRFSDGLTGTIDDLLGPLANPLQSRVDPMFAHLTSGLGQGSRGNPYYFDEDAGPDDHRDYEGYAHPGQTEADIKGLLDNVTDDADAKEETPEQLSVDLKEHQKIGLAWLRKMEEHTNRGGILADDMGLGKTIQALALIIARPSEDPACKTTLIVAPVALLRQWEKEIQTKVKPRYRLKTHIYHGTSRKRDFNELRKFDVVMTTYGTLASEVKKKEKNKQILVYNENARIPPKDRCPLLDDSSKWYRVILDEAQAIKNNRSLTNKATTEISSQHRWCMTGTPMMNNVVELHGLVRFLSIKPYCYWNRFRQDISGPIKAGDDRGMERLRVLWKAIALRRKKDSKINGQPIIVIPPKFVKVVHAVFDDDQKILYQALETKGQLKMNKYLRSGTVMNNYTNILLLLLRMRQACCHPHLISDLGVAAPGNMTVDKMKELAAKFAPEVVARIRSVDVEEEGFTCPICLDATCNPSLAFPCGHETCMECFSKVTDPANAPPGNDGEPGKPKCPQCRELLDPNNVVDYNTFRRIHMPETLTEEELALDAGSGDEESSDDDDDEDGDDVDDDEEESEDEMEGSDLDGFIVNDDEEDEGGEEEYSRKQKKAVAKRKAKGKGKVTIKDYFEDDEDAASGINGSSSRRRSRIVKDEDDESVASNNVKDEIQDDDDIDVGSAPKQKGKSKVKSEIKEENGEELALTTVAEESGAESKPKSKGKGKANGKAKEKKKPKKTRPPKMTLAQLKQLSRRSKDARRKYFKRLEKTWIPSAKIEKALEVLRDIRANDETEKIIIFSQWTSFLDLLEVPIRHNDWGYQRYDGSMGAKERIEAVENFTENPRCTILLTSLKAGNAGLNLHQASQVIMLDPFWNPYTEDQAVDRAHRFPQQRTVHVHRILITETVEDRIMALQEQKKKLIESAMDENAIGSLGKLGVSELRYLFGLPRSG